MECAQDMGKSESDVGWKQTHEMESKEQKQNELAMTWLRLKKIEEWTYTVHDVMQMREKKHKNEERKVQFVLNVADKKILL